MGKRKDGSFERKYLSLSYHLANVMKNIKSIFDGKRFLFRCSKWSGYFQNVFNMVVRYKRSFVWKKEDYF